MERLTNRCEVGICGTNKKVALFPLYKVGLNNDYSDKGLIQECFKKLADYEDLEEQGRLVKLPCKVGDTVYKMPSEVNYRLNILNKHQESNKVYCQVVSSIFINKNGYILNTCDGLDSVLDKHFNETWFLTKQEAEDKLKEME